MVAAKKPRVTKWQAEEAIFARFSKAYESRYQSTLLSPIHEDKPDFVATDSKLGRAIGIEVTGAYQDDREAEINYWLEGSWGMISGSLDGLIGATNQRIAEKSEKAYAYWKVGPLVLAIWIGSFVFNQRKDMKSIEPMLTIPENPFSLISLVVTEDTDPEPALFVLQEDPAWRQIDLA
jgi:hypothetical protein